MRNLIKYLVVVMLGFGLGATSATAQNLTTFVEDPQFGATQLQIQTGRAVQAACATLAGLGGFQLTGAPGDLFLRCNELVQTAQALQDQSTPRGRDLGLSSPELLGAVQQVAGEELLGQATLSARVTNGQFSNIAGRLNALRLGGASAAGGQVASTSPYGNPDRNLPGYSGLSIDSRTQTGGAAASDIAGKRLGWFLEGSFNTGDRDQTANEDGFDFDSTSLTIGLDYLLNAGVIGVSLGVDNYDADFVNSVPVVSGGSLEVEGTSGSIFAALNRGAVYFDAIASFGSLDTDTTRIANYSSNNTCDPTQPCPGENDTLAGETDGDYLALGATIGFDSNPGGGNWDLSSTLSLAFRDINIDGYNETDVMGGGLPLSFADQEIESLRTILGFAFTGNFSRSFGVLSPQLRVEWHHEFEDDPVPLVAKYVVEESLNVPGAAGPGVFSLSGQCISCFQVNSDEIDTDFGLVGVGLSAVFSQRIQIYGAYDALVGIDNITSNTFSVGIRGQF